MLGETIEMDSVVEVMEPAEASEAKRRGRPPRQTVAAETPLQRVERIRRELQQAEAEWKASEEERANIIGKGAMRHLKRNAQFARQLADALRAEVTARTEREKIADLIGEDGQTD
jgi:hypothetical protein